MRGSAGLKRPRPSSAIEEEIKSHRRRKKKQEMFV
jgi:hypothetical protein